MKSLYYPLIAAMIGMGCVQARAAESWEPRLYGAEGGTAMGFVPPEGLYFSNLNIIAPNDPTTDINGKKTSNRIDIVTETPSLYWVTPWEVLGAKYAVAIADSADIIDLKVNSPGAAGGKSVLGGAGFFGTTIMPVSLGWTLPDNFFLNLSLSVSAPTGTYRNPLAVAGGALTGINYFAFDPQIGVSWLKDGWNISAKAYYLANMRDLGWDYKTGDVFGTEETISKTIGKWTFGVTGFTMTQIQNDTGAAVAQLYGPAIAAQGNRMGVYGAGVTAGYNFGPVIVQGWCDHPIKIYNYAAGDLCYLRTTIPLGANPLKD